MLSLKHFPWNQVFSFFFFSEIVDLTEKCWFLRKNLNLFCTYISILSLAHSFSINWFHKIIFKRYILLFHSFLAKTWLLLYVKSSFQKFNFSSMNNFHRNQLCRLERDTVWNFSNFCFKLLLRVYVRFFREIEALKVLP